MPTSVSEILPHMSTLLFTWLKAEALTSPPGTQGNPAFEASPPWVSGTRHATGGSVCGKACLGVEGMDMCPYRDSLDSQRLCRQILTPGTRAL